MSVSLVLEHFFLVKICAKPGLPKKPVRIGTFVFVLWCHGGIPHSEYTERVYEKPALQRVLSRTCSLEWEYTGKKGD
jgi:hypothetical protein